ncbi:rho guanine nucleotide exchange factor 16-like [Scleropages formosus]|uniref:Rho guanine nucleotide exchange factor (GEF) 16 n=2 Tax=Scleropages formosus TaxID=113540 RepID=A0A8C9RJ16_SCLFO|nr:rho guanine nucleotide exchange factor 16 [Scleropages formosus]XP_018592114.2 rho guanine nucleotide exchange factor 16 [Scleropages formosus]XP_018592116.2 rho guanine nucleotide exchange factor 16 [Scleropages formosus]XP_018592117.2 rho guanine nucleotide exchange factor 16 [Scleropages formosus]
MSQQQSDSLAGDEAPLLDAGSSAPDLQVDRGSGAVDDPPVSGQAEVVLSTDSLAALKLGTQQIIPKGLAVASRPRVRPRHHTAVVTLPVTREARPVPFPEVQLSQASAEDDDIDGAGVQRRMNRRNMSYRVAMTSVGNDIVSRTLPASALKAVSEDETPSVQPPSGQEGDKRALRRRTGQKKGGSFKDDPQLYQEIRERGLHAEGHGGDGEAPDEQPGRDRNIVVKSFRPTQLTWSQLPQVQETGVLESMSAEERKRQEAMFEIITSEYSYQHSLGILVRHFKESAELRATMTKTEHHHLFSNISVIQAISQKFFEELDMRHQENPILKDISDIVQRHASNHFSPYITYCSNETFQQRTLQKLLSSNSAFKEVLKRLECSAECGGLPIISFLILPMQRVTRLPLLMDTICQKTPLKTVEHASTVFALKTISKLVKKCNDGARTMERTEQMYTIQKQMEFGKIKPFPLISASRWLLKSGELAVCLEELNIFSKAFSHKSFFLFLFNDVLIITKKKSEESYIVIEYATLDNVTVELEPQAIKQGGSAPFPLKLSMKKNGDGRFGHLVLAAESQLDRARWVKALQKRQQFNYLASKEGLPQCEVIKAYIPKQPDELGLQQAELVIILQREEGWLYGERMRDGEQGWFPASCATEITDLTAVAGNMRRMQRLRETNV